MLHPITREWSEREETPSRPDVVEYRSIDGDSFFMPYTNEAPVIVALFCAGEKDEVGCHFILHIPGLEEGESEDLVRRILPEGWASISSEDTYRFRKMTPKETRVALEALGVVYGGTCGPDMEDVTV